MDFQEVILNSSRFITGLMARLHARSVPPVEYDRRSVAVGVVSVPACSADEYRLAFAAPAVHGPAGRAGLRGIGCINLDQFSGFVGKHSLNLIPTHIQDGPVKAPFLGHVLSRRFYRTASTGRHALCSQRFDDHCAIAAANIGSSCVRPVFANTGLTGFKMGRLALCLGVSCGASLAAAGDTLGFAKPAFRLIEPGRQEVSGAVRKHDGDRNAPIYANRSGQDGAYGVSLAAETDLPAKGGARNCSIRDFTIPGSRISEFYPADFRQSNTTPPLVNLFNPNVFAWIRKAVIDALAFKGWVSGLSFAGSFESKIKGLQYTGLTVGVSGADEIHFGPQPRQLSPLADVIQVIAGAGVKIASVVKALIQREIPYQPAQTRKLLNQCSLFLRWAQRVGISSISHSQIIPEWRTKSQ